MYLVQPLCTTVQTRVHVPGAGAFVNWRNIPPAPGEEHVVMHFSRSAAQSDRAPVLLWLSAEVDFFVVVLLRLVLWLSASSSLPCPCLRMYVV